MASNGSGCSLKKNRVIKICTIMAMIKSTEKLRIFKYRFTLVIELLLGSTLEGK